MKQAINLAIARAVFFYHTISTFWKFMRSENDPRVLRGTPSWVLKSLANIDQEEVDPNENTIRSFLICAKRELVTRK